MRIPQKIVRSIRVHSLFQIESKGFTLVEIVVSVAIVVILAVLSIFILDPARQIAKSRNNERKAHVNLVLNAVGQNIFDNKGDFSCSTGDIPTTTARMATSTGNYDIGPCLVPDYLQSLPFDPSTSSARWTSVSDYDTGYNIIQNATTGRVTISAPAAELDEEIEATR